MYYLKKEVLVSYTAQQMFELINDIEEYPQFLPWCEQGIIISQSDNEMLASLMIAWQGIHKQFTTRNRLYPHQRIEISLVNHPRYHLAGIWHFNEVESHYCRVILDLEFELTGYIVDKVLQPIMQSAANTLMDAFYQRAKKRYGEK